MQNRQCPSCGGICKRHCERADVPQRLSDEEIMKTLWITGNEEPSWIAEKLKDARAIEAKVRGQ